MKEIVLSPLKTIAGWMIYGLLTSVFVYFLFPSPVAGGARLVIVMSVFLILGSVDFILSKFFSNSQ